MRQPSAALLGLLCAGLLHPVLAQEAARTQGANPRKTRATRTKESPTAKTRADQRYHDQLLDILKQTRSADTFLVTLSQLQKVGADHRKVVPVAIRQAERLGVFAGNLRPGERPDPANPAARRAAMVWEILEGMDRRTAVTSRSANAEQAPRFLILATLNRDKCKEFPDADHELQVMFGQSLRELVAARKEKITLVPVREVEKYKNTHPTWLRDDLSQVGQKLRADWVISLEIHSLSLYEPGSRDHLYLGRASVSVRLVEVGKPEVVKRRVISFRYPAERPIAAYQDVSLEQFGEHFSKRLAHELATACLEMKSPRTPSAQSGNILTRWLAWVFE